VQGRQRAGFLAPEVVELREQRLAEAREQTPVDDRAAELALALARERLGTAEGAERDLARRAFGVVVAPHDASPAGEGLEAHDGSRACFRTAPIAAGPRGELE